MPTFWDHVYVFLMSMVPVVELRGAIPLGDWRGLHWLVNYLLAVAGNFLPVPFILLFIRRILEWMKTTKHLSRIALWLEKKAARGSEKVQKYASFGLLLLVAIPLPGTGAWTGALVAALMNMKKKYALISILLGVMIAGVIVTLAVQGVVGVFEIFVPK